MSGKRSVPAQQRDSDGEVVDGDTQGHTGAIERFSRGLDKI